MITVINANESKKRQSGSYESKRAELLVLKSPDASLKKYASLESKNLTQGDSVKARVFKHKTNQKGGRFSRLVGEEKGSSSMGL